MLDFVFGLLMKTALLCDVSPCLDASGPIVLAGFLLFDAVRYVVTSFP